MKNKTLEEICGYNEPAHLFAHIKELEAKVETLKDALTLIANGAESAKGIAKIALKEIP